MAVQYQGVWSLQSAAQLQSTQRWVTDPLFENTTLLLQADDAANGAQNNTFLDSSSNAFAITRNPASGPNAPTQGSFTPFSLQPGAWGNFFDGTDDFLQKTSPAAGLYDWTSTNWTLEYWIYANAFGQGTNTVSNVVGNATDGGSTVYWSFGPIASGVVRWYYYNGGSVNLDTSTVLSTGRWHHLAFVNNSNTLTVYVDGVASATAAKAGTPQFSSGTPFTIGKITGSSFNGYISNLRITQSAVYTANFTPSSIPLSPISGTQLMTCQSNRFLDNSTNAVVFTPSGTPSVQPFSPFAPQYQWTPSVIGGSGYFDGTGDYLNFTGSLAISGQFSVECWFYRTTSDNNQRTLFAFNSTNTSYASIRLDTDSANVNGRIVLNMSTSGSSWAATPTVNSAYFKYGWNHIVCTRDSSNGVRIIINGVLQSSSTLSGALYSTSTTHAIGCNNLPGAAANLFFGYVAGLRLVNGSIPTDYQTSSTTVGAIIFTPPTAPVTASSQGATSSNVSLLTNFTNAGIVDATMKNNLETVGNAQISTAVVKYGSGSMFFDGTGDWLSIPASPNLVFGTGAFTIEFWFRIAGSTGTRYNLLGNIGSGDTSIGVYVNTTNTLISGTFNNNVAVSSGTVTNNTWYHYALTWDGTIYRQFINGTIDGTSTTARNLSDSTTSWQIGSMPWSSANPLNGYIDDLRITKGIARYTANFIPPSVALPRQ